MDEEPQRPEEEWDPKAWSETDRADQPARRRPLSAPVLVAAVVLAIFGLIGIGIGVSETVFNRGSSSGVVEPVSAGASPLGTASSSGPSQTAQPPVIESAPEVEEEPSAGSVGAPSAEPVVDVARAVVPSVVLIEVDDLGLGSGIIYDNSGHILTNAHVIAGADTVTVQLFDGTRTEGRVVGAVTSIDVAVVKIDPTDLELVPATFADLSTVEVGQLAVAVGSPYGLEQSVTAGIISALSRESLFPTGSEDGVNVEMIQTDAPINRGNSGGPLADLQGRVIGINSQILTGLSGDNIGIGFAIPADTALDIAEQILSGEMGGFLGITGVTPAEGDPGALVLSVTPGSPAEVGGLQVGDLIVRLGGETVDSMNLLVLLVQERRPGTILDVEVVRDDVRIDLTITLGVYGAGSDTG